MGTSLAGWFPPEQPLKLPFQTLQVSDALINLGHVLARQLANPLARPAYERI